MTSRHSLSFSIRCLGLVALIQFVAPWAMAQSQVVLTDGQKKVRVSRAQLGASHSGGAWKVDAVALKRTLAHVAPRFKTAARNARVVASGRSVRIVPSVAARKMDVAASTHRIAALLVRDPATRVLRLVMIKRAPHIPTSALKGISGVISRFTTHFNAGNAKRAHNLRLAASRLDGRLIFPRKVLSLNEVVGERTQKNGFLTAPVIEYGKKVPGIGGGASQVAGTFFNAAVLAGLAIEQYQTHAKPVAYLPIARDATISEQIDLKVRNNTKAPVYIAAKPSGNRLTVSLYGAPVRGRKIGLAVSKKKLGPAHITAALYRIVKQNGKLVHKERIGRSEYQWKDTKASSLAVKRE